MLANSEPRIFCRKINSDGGSLKQFPSRSETMKRVGVLPSVNKHFFTSCSLAFVARSGSTEKSCWTRDCAEALGLHANQETLGATSFGANAKT